MPRRYVKTQAVNTTSSKMENRKDPTRSEGIQSCAGRHNETHTDTDRAKTQRQEVHQDRESIYLEADQLHLSGTQNTNQSRFRKRFILYTLNCVSMVESEDTCTYTCQKGPSSYCLLRIHKVEGFTRDRLKNTWIF